MIGRSTRPCAPGPSRAGAGDLGQVLRQWQQEHGAFHNLIDVHVSVCSFLKLHPRQGVVMGAPTRKPPKSPALCDKDALTGDAILLTRYPLTRHPAGTRANHPSNGFRRSLPAAAHRHPIKMAGPNMGRPLRTVDDDLPCSERTPDDCRPSCSEDNGNPGTGRLQHLYERPFPTGRA